MGDKSLIPHVCSGGDDREGRKERCGDDVGNPGEVTASVKAISDKILSRAAESEATYSATESNAGATLVSASSCSTPLVAVMPENIAMAREGSTQEARRQPIKEKRVAHGGQRAGPWAAPRVVLRQPPDGRRREQERASSRRGIFRPLILCPLQNLGNTCYFNAGIQILANCPAFVYCLAHSPFLEPRPGAIVGQPGYTPASRPARPPVVVAGNTGTSRASQAYQLLCSVARLLYDMEDFRPNAVVTALAPVTALRHFRALCPSFDGGAQQDCTEMLNAVIGAVEDGGGLKLHLDTLLQSFDTDQRRMPALMPNYFSSSVDRDDDDDDDDSGDESLVVRTNTPPPTSSSLQSAQQGSTEAGKWEQKSGQARAAAAHHGLTPRARAEALARIEGNFLLASDEAAAVEMRGRLGDHHTVLLRLMQKINRDNAALERRAQDRKRAQSMAAMTSASVFTAPTLYYNPVTDIFKGYTLSQIRCHHCQNVSRVVEPFTSLLLDIPTHRQRVEYARRHPHVRRCGPDGTPLQPKRRRDFTWWNPFSCLLAVYHCMSDWLDRFSFVRYPLTLQECLDIHFEEVALKGNNLYRCDACGQQGEATKSTTLLAMPEYLLLHMKRFRAGHLFNTKKTDSVVFPVDWSALSAREAAATTLQRVRPEILDLRDYADPALRPFIAQLPACLRVDLADGATGASCHPTAAPCSNAGCAPTTAQPAVSTQRGAEAASSATSLCHDGAAAATAATASLAAPPVISTYSLAAVVNHHGSSSYGHYTVYTHKQDGSGGAWVYVSDQQIARASAAEVADSEEYLLLYHQQPAVETAETAVERVLRDKARHCLLHPFDSGAATEAGTTCSPPHIATADTVNEPTQPTSASSEDREAVVFAEPEKMVFISRLWLQRMAFYNDPGPIINRRCYCGPEEGRRGSAGHVHLPLEQYYVPIRASDYAAFYAVYGGNAPVTVAEYDRLASDISREVAV